MNLVELSVCLKSALEDSGRTPWELSRRADVRLTFVEALLEAAGSAPVEALVRIAQALELEVHLCPAPPPTRNIGPIPSTVDRALERIDVHDLTRPPQTPFHLAEFLLRQRRLLDLLEAFGRSGAYAKLLHQAGELMSEAPPEGTAAWLLQHVPALGGIPIELACTDHDISRIAKQLAERATGRLV